MTTSLPQPVRRRCKFDICPASSYQELRLGQLHCDATTKTCGDKLNDPSLSVPMFLSIASWPTWGQKDCHGANQLNLGMQDIQLVARACAHFIKYPPKENPKHSAYPSSKQCVSFANNVLNVIAGWAKPASVATPK